MLKNIKFQTKIVWFSEIRKILTNILKINPVKNKYVKIK